MRKIPESKEDYLEAIYLLSLKNCQVRSVDIAKQLKVSKPSTSNALKLLSEQGYIEKEIYGRVKLTTSGTIYATHILQKHRAIKRLLTDYLHVEPAIAEIDACRIEHYLSDQTVEKIFELLKKEDPNAN